MREVQVLRLLCELCLIVAFCNQGQRPWRPAGEAAMGDAEEEEVEVGTVPLPPSFAWTDLTKAEIEAFMALSTPEETLSYLPPPGPSDGCMQLEAQRGAPAAGRCTGSNMSIPRDHRGEIAPAWFLGCEQSRCRAPPLPIEPEQCSSSSARRSRATLRSWIAGKFALSDYETNAQTTVLVDFYLWILRCLSRALVSLPALS